MIQPLQFSLETMRAIQLLHRAGHYGPLLTVLYAGIDTLAWLDTSHAWATGDDFKAWVDRYLLPGSGLRCTAHDFWAARCGLIHTRTAESRDMVKGGARQVWYYGRGRSERLLRQITKRRSDVVAVRIVSLITAFGKGSVRFANDIDRDPVRAERVKAKATKWLQWMPVPSPSAA
jgi:hypothetical protein